MVDGEVNKESDKGFNEQHALYSVKITLLFILEQSYE